MKQKRITALLLAVLMALTLVPAAALFAEAPAEDAAESTIAANREKNPEKGSNLYGNYANSDGCSVSYTSPGTYPFKRLTYNTDSGSYKFVQSANATVPNSTSELDADTFFMKKDEVFSFEYWLESEQGGDYMKFIVNGSVKLTKSGKSGGGSSPVWVKYSYTAPEDGTYTIRFIYVKDNDAVDTGADCLRIRNVQSSRQYDQYRFRAACSEGGCAALQLKEISDSSYNFNVVKDESSTTHPLYLKSTNDGKSSSTSSFKMKLLVPPRATGTKVTLSFDYAYQSEENHDYFYFKVDGYIKLQKSGSGWVWDKFEYEFTNAGVYELEWKYVKDSNVSTGVDCAVIDNVRVTGNTDFYDMSSFMRNNLNSSSSSARLVFNTTPGNSSFCPAYSPIGAGYCVTSNNRFTDSSEAKLETIVNMKKGETLSFQYLVSSEANNDRLIFYANYQEQMRASGLSSNSWKTYTFTADATRTFTFTWSYSKDSSTSYGTDSASIRSVCYTGTCHGESTLEKYINNGSGLHFSLGSIYGIDDFMPYTDAATGRTCAISRNKWADGTESEMTTYAIEMKPGDKLSFDYLVSGESFDKLVFYGWSGSEEIRMEFGGSDSTTWKTYQWECLKKGVYNFSWTYVKDSSVSKNQDCAKIDDVRVIRAAMPTLDEAMNAPGSTLHFYNRGEATWVADYDGADLCGSASNTGNLTGSGTVTATVETFVLLYYGDTFEFEYKASTKGSDAGWVSYFSFEEEDYTTGEQLHIEDSNVNTWTKVTYTAFTTGMYTFRWSYTRSADEYEIAPSDFAYVRKCKVTRDHTLPSSTFDQILNSEETDVQLHFTMEGDTFFGDYWRGEDEVMTSYLFDRHGETAVLKSTADLKKGDVLTFQYFVSSEAGYDMFYFTVNGEQIEAASGNTRWRNFEYTIPKDGTFELVWSYVKDGTASRGMDCIKVDTVCVKRQSYGLKGDVNNDGSVTVLDAVLALRGAMGVILDEGETWRADYNDDGDVTVIDAVLILRKSMGII